MKQLNIMDVDFEDQAQAADDRAIKNAYGNQRILDVLEFAIALNDARMPIGKLATALYFSYKLNRNLDKEEQLNKIIKVAAGIATEDKCTEIGQSHMAEALQYTKYYIF